jgi:thymidylate synthase (FAD)
MSIESVNAHQWGTDYRGQVPRTVFHEDSAGISVQLLDWPDESRIAKTIYSFVESTWGDQLRLDGSDEEVNRVFLQALSGRTLPAALEIPKFTFAIGGVTRAVTHELVRHREGGYGQHSQRANDERHMPIRIPATISRHPGLREAFIETCTRAKEFYARAVDSGIHVQDARSILPEHICTNICVTLPYNTLQRALSSRMSGSMYPEMCVVARMMKATVDEKCPTMGSYIMTACDRAKRCVNSDNLVPCTCQWAPDNDPSKYRYEKAQNGSEYLLGRLR